MKSRDYEELLESFNLHGVRYLIVGAHAVAFHARPRATRDLDILVDPKLRNAERVLAAIRSFLGSDLGLTVSNLTSPGNIVQLGVWPHHASTFSRLASADFASLWRKRVAGHFAGVPANFVSLDDLIREKETVGRDQDRADVRVLRMARKRRG
ncbi:MAG TPA: hypothetical protein VMT00_07190 [Thermoanaerobaculia bacterium]|nr:hypothetical protein [Thermoanaerobaculia bacterium]